MFQFIHFRWEGYPISDIMVMSGRVAPPPNSEGDLNDSHIPPTFVVMCPSSKKDYYSKFKTESLPVESVLDQFLTDHINVEITLKTITSKQDAVDWLTWTFFYRRLSKVSVVPLETKIDFLFGMHMS
jgi:pre-mRNA-splicing helicase BRR2